VEIQWRFGRDPSGTHRALIGDSVEIQSKLSEDSAKIQLGLWNLEGELCHLEAHPMGLVGEEEENRRGRGELEREW